MTWKELKEEMKKIGAKDSDEIEVAVDFRRDNLDTVTRMEDSGMICLGS